MRMLEKYEYMYRSLAENFEYDAVIKLDNFRNSINFFDLTITQYR